MRQMKWSVAALLIFFVTTLFAADPAPLVMMRSTSDKMLASLQANRSRLKNNPRLVNTTVRTILLPKVDLITMSRSVVGNNYWRSASVSVQQQFIKEFTELVIQTYAAPLSEFSGERIQFMPLRGYNPAENRLQVQTQIIRPNGQVIPVSYRLLKGDNCAADSTECWRVYDFSVDGISMVQSYRSQFANILSQGGLAKLNSELTKHNRGA